MPLSEVSETEPVGEARLLDCGATEAIEVEEPEEPPAYLKL